MPLGGKWRNRAGKSDRCRLSQTGPEASCWKGAGFSPGWVWGVLGRLCRYFGSRGSPPAPAGGSCSPVSFQCGAVYDVG